MSLDTRLAAELQLLVIGDLDAADIVSLQLTCKYFNNLVKSHALFIWKRCLRRLTESLGLFWPSFKDLSTGQEFKDACTREKRLKDKFERILSNGASSLNPKVVESKTPRAEGEYGGIEWIEDVKLVPGGRYLVTSQLLPNPNGSDMDVDTRPGKIRLVDNGKDGSGPPLRVVAEAVVPAMDSMVSMCVASETKLYVLLVVEGQDLPDSYDIPPNADDCDLVIYHVMEIAYSEDQDAFSMHIFGTLKVVTPVDEEGEAFFDRDAVTIRFADHVIITWDFINNTYTGCQFVLSGIAELLSRRGNVSVFVDELGVQGIEAPPFRPIPNEGYIATPSYYHLTGRYYDFFYLSCSSYRGKLGTVSPIRTTLHRPPLLDESRFYFQVVSVADSDDAISGQTPVHTISRYVFNYADKRPEEQFGVGCSVMLVDRVVSPMPDTRLLMDLAPQTCLLRGPEGKRRMWALWDDLESYEMHASISCSSSKRSSSMIFSDDPRLGELRSPYSMIGHGQVCMNSIADNEGTKVEGVGAVTFLDEQYKFIQSRQDLISCRFDPDAGKVVALIWGRGRSECLIRVYTF